MALKRNDLLSLILFGCTYIQGLYIIYYIYIIYIYIYIYIYINIYIYTYINFKAINNALDAKMVLKTHLFIKNISLSLQKLRSLTKHQTKINTAIITNQLKLQKK